MTTPSRLSCKEVFERLDDYVDRELAPEEMARVAEHLHVCADCTSSHDFEESIIRSLKDRLRRITLPDALAERILGAVSRGETPAGPPDSP